MLPKEGGSKCRSTVVSYNRGVVEGGRKLAVAPRRFVRGDDLKTKNTASKSHVGKHSTYNMSSERIELEQHWIFFIDAT